MVETEKLAVVRGLIEKEFPGCKMEQGRVADGYTFEISFKGSKYVMVLSDEFIRGYSPSEIGPQLVKYTVIEHLRDLPNTPVVVTSAGLKLQYDQT